VARDPDVRAAGHRGADRVHSPLGRRSEALTGPPWPRSSRRWRTGQPA
jgi:hypothetical protein